MGRPSDTILRGMGKEPGAYYVDLDCERNTITLSLELTTLIRRFGRPRNRSSNLFFFVFNETNSGLYGFVHGVMRKDGKLNTANNQEINPWLYAPSTYDKKRKRLSFQSLIPTVNMIAHNYRLPFDQHRLGVRLRKAGEGEAQITYFEIQKT